jgi:hypothetical protein
MAAEAAGHWAAAGRPVEELPAQIWAAEAAERVYGYAVAAAHWRRAIDLCETLPDEAREAGIDPAPLYLRAVHAFRAVGALEQGRRLRRARCDGMPNTRIHRSQQQSIFEQQFTEHYPIRPPVCR